jgi:hypothetical protein
MEETIKMRSRGTEVREDEMGLIKDNYINRSDLVDSLPVVLAFKNQVVVAPRLPGLSKVSKLFHPFKE